MAIDTSAEPRKKTSLIVGAAVVLVVLAVLAGVTAMITAKDRGGGASSSSSSALENQPVEAARQPQSSCATPTAPGCGGNQVARGFDPSNGKCRGTGIVPLTSPPLPLSEVGLVEPLGQMIGGHVTPIDHGYIFGIDGHQGSTPNEYEVLAPADGLLVSMTATARSGNESFVDHAVTFSITCTLSVHYLNMDSFDEHIAQQSGDVTTDRSWDGAIPVKAGEVIGHTGQHGIDIFVWNADLTLTGFVRPDQYTAGEDWKTHTADPYEYFAEPIKSQLLAKDPRVATPRGGKIDYDIDGRLIGSWFKESSGGYTAGGNRGDGYWKGHLAIAPDAYDPSRVMVSVGDWGGEARQFGIRGTYADPAEVSTASGVVTYELSQPNWVVVATGARWDNDTYKGPVRFEPSDSIQGVLLVRLVEDRRLEVEMFPGKTASQVAGFDANAVYYER